MSALAKLQNPSSPIRSGMAPWLALGRGDPRGELGEAGWQSRLLGEMSEQHESVAIQAAEVKKETLVREIIEWDSARYEYWPRPTVGVSHGSRVERLNEVPTTSPTQCPAVAFVSPFNQQQCSC